MLAGIRQGHRHSLRFTRFTTKGLQLRSVTASLRTLLSRLAHLDGPFFMPAFHFVASQT
jgi:hypothetical protein